ncbi:MAG: type VI secretion system tube protein Hcp [Nannocystaceae bacterium]
MKLSEIEGESMDSQHPKEIELSSFRWGTFSGGGKAKSEGLVIVKSVDRTSPTLFQRCVLNLPLATAQLSVRKSGANASTTHDFIKITMTNVRIDAVRPSGSASDDLPHEEVVLLFTSMKIEVQEFNKQGAPAGLPIEGSWDFVAHKQI